MVYTLVVHLHAKEGEENLSKLKAKLAEASQVYSKDKETLGWYVILCVWEISTVVVYFEKGQKEGKKMLRSLWKRVLCCAVRIILGRIELHWLIDFFSKLLGSLCKIISIRDLLRLWRDMRMRVRKSMFFLPFFVFFFFSSSHSQQESFD